MADFHKGEWKWQMNAVRYATKRSIRSTTWLKNAQNVVHGFARTTWDNIDGNAHCAWLTPWATKMELRAHAGKRRLRTKFNQPPAVAQTEPLRMEGIECLSKEVISPPGVTSGDRVAMIGPLGRATHFRWSGHTPSHRHLGPVDRQHKPLNRRPLLSTV